MGLCSKCLLGMLSWTWHVQNWVLNTIPFPLRQLFLPWLRPKTPVSSLTFSFFLHLPFCLEVAPIGSIFFFKKVNTHVLTTSYHLHYYHCGLNHHHFSLGLRQYFPNWLSGSSLLNPRAREIQLKQSEHASPSVAPRISQSESQVFSRSPMWPAPTLSSTPLPPCLVHSPLLR